MINRKTIILIILLGAVLRLFLLGGLPRGFFRDEAAIGYNAYSILLTGKDEFGMQLPIVFRSFEVFFLPLYIYLSAPIIGVFGLNPFAVRLLSSISGIFAIFLIYKIAKEIWNQKTGLFAAFVLAISPWNIFYSRGAFEGNLALTLFLGGFYFWMRFLRLKSRSTFFLSILFFTLSMYSYQAERLIIPLFASVAITLSRKMLWKKRTKLFTPTAIVLILLLPLLSLSFQAGGYHRAVGVSIFSKDLMPPGWVDGISNGLFVNNLLFLRLKQLSALYLSYFSPRNLFAVGDFDRQRSVEFFSVFYTWMIPLFIIGIFNTFKKMDINKKLLLAWFLLAPLPAAMTTDPFHTYRSLLVYIPVSIFIGYGLYLVYKFVEKMKLNILATKIALQKIYLGIVAVFSIIFLSLFIFSYAIITPTTRARYWDHGYGEIISFINNKGFERIVVDDSMSEPYIHYLFFGNVNPNDYHKEVAKFGELSDYYYNDPSEIRPKNIGNVEFREVDWPSERGDDGTVFIMEAKLLPDSEFITDPKIELIKEIYYPDGEVAYKIVKVND